MAVTNTPTSPDPREPTKRLCFIIGPIGDEGSPTRKHADFLRHGLIGHVLEAKEFNYTVKRADEDADPGMITDHLIADIVHADLVVADLTELNPNVFWELGVRHAAEKPVIHIAATNVKLPFDNLSHRAIFVDISDWKSLEEARERLANSARRIEAPDYLVTNPITHANAIFKMRESADPRDRVFAEMQERLAALTRQVQDLLGGQVRAAWETINPRTRAGNASGFGRPQPGFASPGANALSGFAANPSMAKGS